MPKLGMEPIRRQQIRKAAAKVIARKGFNGATLRDVAAAARLSTGTVNHYYGSKLAVLMDALLFVSERFQAEAREALTSAPPGLERFRAVVRACTADSSYEARKGYAVWMWASAEALRSRPLATLIRERRDSFKAILKAAIESAFPALEGRRLEAVADEFDAYFNGICMQILAGGREIDFAVVETSLVAIARAHLATQGDETAGGAAGDGASTALPGAPVNGPSGEVQDAVVVHPSASAEGRTAATRRAREG